MTVALHLRHPLNGRLDLSDLLPYLENVAPGRFPSLAELAEGPVVYGRHRSVLGKWFDISGDPTFNRVEWHGDLAQVDGLGGGRLPGHWQVHGHVGHRWGMGLTRGRLDVLGNAGDDLGNSMVDGVLTVAGNAGERVGGPCPGAKTGLAGGAIVVGGTCGPRAGWRMRRGTIVVMGEVDRDAAWQMQAGTLVASGAWRETLAADARRGTIIVMDPHHESLPRPFVQVCRYRPLMLQTLLHWLAATFPMTLAWRDLTLADLYHDPTGQHGMCEILIARKDLPEMVDTEPPSRLGG